MLRSHPAWVLKVHTHHYLLLSCGQALKDGEIKWMRSNRCSHFEIYYHSVLEICRRVAITTCFILTMKYRCVRIFNTHAGCERSIKPNFPITYYCITYYYIDPSFIDASAPLEKNFQNGDTCWGAFIWSRHLLLIDHTTVISFFVGIRAFSQTWCNVGARFFAEGFFIEKNSKMGTPVGAHSFDLVIF